MKTLGRMGIAILLSAAACGGDPETNGAPSAAAATGSSGAGAQGGGSTSTTSSASASATSSASSASGGAGSGAGGMSPACGGTPAPAGDKDYTLTWAGAERTYRVHAPPGYDGAQLLPLTLVIHGLDGTNDEMQVGTKMESFADPAGWIVVYPQGLSKSWNAGSCCGTSQSSVVDDIGFIGAMLDAIEAAYCVDPKRVYSSGFSNGGMLSHRIGCELSDRIAAIGPVSGTMAIDDCAPTRPVPVMHFHGTSDIVVPYNVGLFAQSVPDTISGWVARNGCGTTPMTTFSMGSAHCESYDGCMQDATVTLCTLEGGGHQWPGGEPLGIGTVNMDISASEALLDFFAAHPLP